MLVLESQHIPVRTQGNVIIQKLIHIGFTLQRCLVDYFESNGTKQLITSSVNRNKIHASKKWTKIQSVRPWNKLLVIPNAFISSFELCCVDICENFGQIWIYDYFYLPINFCPDKAQAISEICRTKKPKIHWQDPIHSQLW